MCHTKYTLGSCLKSSIFTSMCVIWSKQHKRENNFFQNIKWLKFMTKTPCHCSHHWVFTQWHTLLFLKIDDLLHCTPRDWFYQVCRRNLLVDLPFSYGVWESTSANKSGQYNVNTNILQSWLPCATTIHTGFVQQAISGEMATAPRHGPNTGQTQTSAAWGGWARRHGRSVLARA